MITNLYSLGTATYVTGEELAKKIYVRIACILIGLVLLMLTMWAINANGHKEVNYIFFFLGGAFSLFVGFAPRLLVYSMILGAGVAGLNDQDLSQGALKGVKTLLRVVVSTVFWFWVMAGFLSTWSLQEAPFSFVVIAAGSAMLAALCAYYELKAGKIVMTIVMTYAVLMIIAALYQTKRTAVEGAFDDATEWLGGDSLPDAAPMTPCQLAVCKTFAAGMKQTFKPKHPNAPFTWTRDDNSNGVLGVRFNGGKERKWLPGGLLPFNHTVATFTVRHLSGDPVSIILGTPKEVEAARTQYAENVL